MSDDTKIQEVCGKLVEREVHYCVSSLALEARKRLTEIHDKTTAYQTTRSLSVAHDDGSVFVFTCCYYVIEGQWLFVIPEHQEQQMFHVDDCRYWEPATRYWIDERSRCGL